MQQSFIRSKKEAEEECLDFGRSMYGSSFLASRL